MAQYNYTKNYRTKVIIDISKQYKLHEGKKNDYSINFEVHRGILDELRYTIIYTGGAVNLPCTHYKSTEN